MLDIFGGWKNCNFFLWCLKFMIFLGVNGRCWARAYVWREKESTPLGVWDRGEPPRSHFTTYIFVYIIHINIHQSCIPMRTVYLLETPQNPEKKTAPSWVFFVLLLNLNIKTQLIRKKMKKKKKKKTTKKTQLNVKGLPRWVSLPWKKARFSIPKVVFLWSPFPKNCLYPPQF